MDYNWNNFAYTKSICNTRNISTLILSNIINSLAMTLVISKAKLQLSSTKIDARSCIKEYYI